MPPRRIDTAALPSSSLLRQHLHAREIDQRPTVEFEFDGRSVQAKAGEPLAVALLAAGFDTLARSVKFHRPRGPMCMRGGCEGCLTRVDDVPNVMTCRVPCADRQRVHSQNAFPSASLDVLRVTDWFFPKRFDHHQLLVNFGPTINRAMQVFARRMAGLGTLPYKEAPIPEPEVLDIDALVVGGGAAGLAAAATIARSGAKTLLLEEEEIPGGILLESFMPLGECAPITFARALTDTTVAHGATLRTRTSVLATFDEGTIACTPERALFVRPRARIFANGTHETVGIFQGNDLPGIYTARAALRALMHGVLVGERIALSGGGPSCKELARVLPEAKALAGSFVGLPVEAWGRGRIKGATFEDTEGTRKALPRTGCDALVVDTGATPAFELLGQAGIAILPRDDRFVPAISDEGSTERKDVFAAGSVRGNHFVLSRADSKHPLDADGPVADGVRTGEAVVRFLQKGTHG